MSLPKDQPLLLIICNHPMRAAALKKLLREDFTLLFAQEDEDAIETLRGTDIDAVLIDGKNAAIYPFVTCQKIRSLSSYRLTPILLITPNLKKAYSQAALQAGFNDFIHEPLEQDEILQRLAVNFSRAQMQQKVSGLSSIIAKSAESAKQTDTTLALGMRKLIKADFFQELVKARAIANPICLLLIEIDNYPQLIKAKGKKTAEAVLQEVGVFLRQHMRSKDLLFPQGNTCFFAILPTTSESAGRTLAEMLREEVGDKTFSSGKTACKITVSVGLVHYDKKTKSLSPSTSTFEKLINNAVTALQFARKKGNRTTSSSDKEIKNYELTI